MVFKSGNIPWNKGKKRPKFSEEWKKKLGDVNRGRKFSKEHCANMSKARKGKKRTVPAWNKGKKRNVTWGVALSKALKGKKKSLDHRRKIGKANSGSNSHLWRGGITEEYVMRLSTLDWALIRATRIKMDGGRCQVCGEFNKKLEVHHIVPWRISKDDSLDNLMTVCRQCHLRLERSWKNE